MKKYLFAFMAFILIFSVPVDVYAAEIDNVSGVLWDGSITLSGMNQMFDLYLSSNVQSTNSYYNYGNKHNINIKLENADGINSNKYLSGYVRYRLTLNAQIPSGYTSSFLTAYADPVVMNGLYVTLESINIGSNNSIFDLYIYFDNFYLNNDSITIPILINTNMLLNVPNSYNANGSYTVVFSYSADYAGELYMFNSLEDVPSMDGYFAEQNQEMINQNQEIINQNYYDQQLQEQQNLLQQQQNQRQEQVLSDADTAFAGDSSGLSGALGDMEDAEGELAESNFQALEDYDYEEADFSNLLPEVQSTLFWISNQLQLYFLSTQFSSGFYIITGLTLSALILGIYKIWR